MEKKLLRNIKSENQQKLAERGGKTFLKHELKSSDVRLSCREAKNIISKTKKYLKGDFYKTLAQTDKANSKILQEQ